MAVSAARVAGLAARRRVVPAAAVAPAALLATVTAAIPAAALRATPGNMSDLAALVALLAGSAAARATVAAGAGGGLIRAVARDVAGLAAAIAWLFLLWRLAFAAQMAFFAAVVACRVALRRAVAGLMGGIAALNGILADCLSISIYMTLK